MISGPQPSPLVVLPFQLVQMTDDPTTGKPYWALFSVTLFDTTEFSFVKHGPGSPSMKRRYLLFKRLPMGSSRPSCAPFYTPGAVTKQTVSVFDGMFKSGYRHILWTVS